MLTHRAEVVRSPDVLSAGRKGRPWHATLDQCRWRGHGTGSSLHLRSHTLPRSRRAPGAPLSVEPVGAGASAPVGADGSSRVAVAMKEWLRRNHDVTTAGLSPSIKSGPWSWGHSQPV